MEFVDASVIAIFTVMNQANCMCLHMLITCWSYVTGVDEMRKSFMSKLLEEVLLKETGQLVSGTEPECPRTHSLQ